MIYTRDLNNLIECDVAVAGAGSAGAVAAIASARAGARTVLIERYGFLGGTSTAVLDTFYGFYTPGSRARKVVGGIADDVVARLERFDACFERPNTYGAGTGVTYHPEYLKVVWEELALEAGVRLLMHAWVQDVEVRDGGIEGLVLATTTGRARLGARVFVDATGDADLCWFAGAPLQFAGQSEPAQLLTTTFRMCNVDQAQRKTIGKADFHARMREASESGAYRLPRREGSDHVTTIPGMMATNMTRVASCGTSAGEYVNAANSLFLTDAEVEGRRQAIEYARFLRDRIPGYAGAHLAGFSTQIGVRETRRLAGQYILTREDVLGARQFDDGIGLCGAPIEDHHAGADTRWEYLPDGQCVGIPFRTLLPREVSNLLVAGRCFSATHDAHASVRSMAQCMAMGQAAGTAAAMACAERTTPAELHLGRLREALRTGGAILELPEAA